MLERDLLPGCVRSFFKCFVPIQDIDENSHLSMNTLSFQEILLLEEYLSEIQKVRF